MRDVWLRKLSEAEAFQKMSRRKDVQIFWTFWNWTKWARIKHSWDFVKESLQFIKEQNKRADDSIKMVFGCYNSSLPQTAKIGRLRRDTFLIYSLSQTAQSYGRNVKLTRQQMIELSKLVRCFNKIGGIVGP